MGADARKFGAEVHVLHVHGVHEQVENGKVRRLLKDVIGKLEAEGARASGEVRLVHNGNTVASSLAWVAISAKADLVAVGSRGRTDLGGLSLGSVSHRVAPSWICR